MHTQFNRIKNHMHTQFNLPKIKTAIAAKDNDALRTMAIAAGWRFDIVALYDDEGIEGEEWTHNGENEQHCFEGDIPTRVIDWMVAHATQSA